MTQNYRETLAALRAERAEVERNKIATEILDHDTARLEAEQRAQEFLAAGDRASASYYLDDAEYAQRSIDEATARLEQVEQQLPPTESELSEAKRAWIARRQDLAANPKLAETAGLAHRYITERMNVRDDSDRYFELMSAALEPAGYEPTPTPDDIAQACGLTAEEYNRGVDKLWQAKANGQYKDRE